MWRKSDNIVDRLLSRQISTGAPNTHIHRARLLYENIVPNYTVYGAEYPDYHIKKFTYDGQYLVCFSRNYQNLIVYRFNWFSYCNKGDNSDTLEEVPGKGRKFESYFSLLYSLNLASPNELISKDVFLITDCNCYGIFATSTPQVSDTPARPTAVPEIPSIEKITFYLVRLRDGKIMDEKKFYDDFIHLTRDVGIFMYDDLISILSVRNQAIHILQVRKTGIFVDVRTIGPFCREDDELILNSHVQEESLFQVQLNNSHKIKSFLSAKGNIDSPSSNFATGDQSSHEDYDMGHINGVGLTETLNDSHDYNPNVPGASDGNPSPNLMDSNMLHTVPGRSTTAVTASPQDNLRSETKDHLLGGVKQRLLSYVFRSIEVQDTDPVVKANKLKRFYYNFQHYVDLVMWKVQFLDRCHLMIKFGSLDGVISQNLDVSHHTVFFAVYNIESTEIVGFQNSYEELLQLFENYHDHFRIAPSYPLYMRFISSYSNNIFARQQFRKQKTVCNNTKSNSSAQVIKRSLPCNSQSLSPAAYFDQSLFQFDEKLISAADQYRPCLEPPIKFISRRKPNVLKFKINPGHEFGPGDVPSKRLASFFFHPIFPFAISIQQAYMQPAIVNFHLRR